MAAPLVLSALPAPNHTVFTQQPDGMFVEVMLHGDEHSSCITTPDGSLLMQKDALGYLRPTATPSKASLEKMRTPSRAPLRIAGSTNDFPARGKQKALAIAVEFPAAEGHPARPFSHVDPQKYFNDLLNADDFTTDGATGSVRKYFLDSSCGRFDITFDFFGPVMMSRPAEYYATKTGSSDLNAWEMVVEACNAIDADVDFSEYDRDGDGIIDNVYIFYAGAGAATGGDVATTIWQHASDVERLTGKRYIYDGLRLGHYACSNEYRDVRPEGSLQTQRLGEGIGTVVHEFSHVMGLPDLYDTKGSCLTPGEWSVMDVGSHLNYSRTPPQYSGFERQTLGWVTPRVIGKTPEHLSLRPSETGECHMIETARENEYFILENRQQTGWDAYIPGHGLLIWKIYYLADYWNANQVNTMPNYPGVGIIEADGIQSWTNRDGDTFPGTTGSTQITDEGYPNLRGVNNDPTGVPISSIMETGGIISYDACKLVTSLDRVIGVKASTVTPTSMVLNWEAVSGYGVGYLVDVYTKDAAGNKTYAGIYKQLMVTGTSRKVEGLQPQTRYYATITATAGSVKSDPSEEISLLTPQMSFAFTYPEVVEATPTVPGSCTLSWLPLENAVSYQVKVVTKQYGEHSVETLDFSSPVSELESTWVTDSPFTIGMAGYFGAESPALSLTQSDSYVGTAALSEDIRTLAFWYRERSGSGSSALLVKVLEGGKWVLFDRLPLPEKMAQGELYETSFPSGITAVRIEYERVTKGSLAIDDITVVTAPLIFETPVEGWNWRNTGDETTATVSGLAQGEDNYISVRGVDQSGSVSFPSEEVKVSQSSSNSLGSVSTGSMPFAVIGRMVISASNAELFNLSGMRVPNPVTAPGVYLVKVDGKVYKIFIK